MKSKDLKMSILWELITYRMKGLSQSKFVRASTAV